MATGNLIGYVWLGLQGPFPIKDAVDTPGTALRMTALRIYSIATDTYYDIGINELTGAFEVISSGVDREEQFADHALRIEGLEAALIYEVRITDIGDFRVTSDGDIRIS